MRIFRAIAIAFLLAGLVCARQSWRTKPYQQWTKEETVKVGSDSPWAQVRYSDISIGRVGSPTAYMRAATIQLRSALPIRQALVRFQQLEKGYEHMSADERAEFDARMRETLDCPMRASQYIVALGPPLKAGPGISGVIPLQSATLSLLKKRVALTNDRGEERELVNFKAPRNAGDEALFFFPRLDKNGPPLLTPGNKKLFFLFDSTFFKTSYGPVALPRRFEFDVSKLIVDGKVEF